MTSAAASFLRLNTRKDVEVPAEIRSVLEKLGWEPVYGTYDYVYRWEADWEKEGKDFKGHSEEIKANVDRALKEHGVPYVFKTFHSGG